MEKIITTEHTTAYGSLMLAEFKKCLCLCVWQNIYKGYSIEEELRRTFDANCVSGSSPLLESAKYQLDEYFSGERHSFDIPLLLNGTEFQQRTWQELAKIPYGATISYKELACRIGNPKAYRAVASANRNNRICIIIPCHRVIGSNGTLTGYSGCPEGLPIKQFLLDLEQAK